MSLVYRQTDTAADDSFDYIGRLAVLDGTAGTTDATVAYTPSDTGTFGFEIDPGEVDWEAGDVVTRLNVVSWSTQVDLNHIRILRVNSDNEVQETLATDDDVTAQPATGVYTRTIAIPAVASPGEGDKLIIEYNATRTSAGGGTRNVVFTPDQNIDTPLEAGEELVFELSKGSFALSGENANLNVARKLFASKGAFVVDGKNANLGLSFNMTLGKGAFSVDGKDANFIRALIFLKAKSEYTLSGKDADLIRAIIQGAQKGTFALDGKDLQFLETISLQLDKGVYTVSGKELSLLYDIIFGAEKGSFTVTGKDVNFVIQEPDTFSFFKGSFTLDGKIGDLLYDRVLIAQAGTCLVDGKDAELRMLVADTLTALKGVFTLSGKEAELSVGRVFHFSSGGFDINALPASFVSSLRQQLFAGVFGVSGKDLSFSLSTAPTGIIRTHVDILEMSARAELIDIETKADIYEFKTLVKSTT